eukprot:gb/GECG01004921.1/.p1 GENE.gb/GECG01004921.1/~~gb/GECG01004921.1/.p1  ORF type:complete len:930 (+),score=139.86 gb/GECG01004921.1/:1-2790(+)
MIRLRSLLSHHSKEPSTWLLPGSRRCFHQSKQRWQETNSGNSMRMASKKQRKAALTLARREIQDEIDGILDASTSKIQQQQKEAPETGLSFSRESHPQEMGERIASQLGVDTIVRRDHSKVSQGKVFSHHDMDTRGREASKKNIDGTAVLGEVIDNPDWYSVEKPGLSGNFNEAEAAVHQASASSSNQFHDNDPIMDPSYYYEAARAADIDLGKYASGESIPEAMEPASETARKSTAMPMPWEHGEWWDSLVPREFAESSFDALQEGKEVPEVQSSITAAELTSRGENSGEVKEKLEQLQDDSDPDVAEAKEWSQRIVRYMARLAALPDSLSAQSMPELDKEGVWEVPSKGVLYNPLRGEENVSKLEDCGAQTIGRAKAHLRSADENTRDTNTGASRSESNTMDLLSGLRDDMSNTAGATNRSNSFLDMSEAHQSAVEEYLATQARGLKLEETSSTVPGQRAETQEGEFGDLDAEKAGSGSGLLARRDPNFRKVIENPEDSEYMSATEDQEDFRGLFREHKQGNMEASSQRSRDGSSNKSIQNEDVDYAAPENPEPERDWGWSDSQPGYHMYKRMEQGQRPSEKSLNHSRAYHPYHKRLLEAMERRDLMTMFLLWNFQRNRAMSSKHGPGGDRPDFLGYHIMLDACARAQCFDVMSIVLDDMTRRAVETTPEMHKLFIKAAALSDNLELAMDAFKKMAHDAGHKTDLHCYSPIILTAMRNRKYDVGFDWFNRMRRAGIYPTDSILRGMAKPLVEDEKYKELHFLWNAIRNHTSVPLQDETWGVLLEGFQKANDAEDLWSVYRDMTSSRYFGGKASPDAAQMCDIFNCLAANRYFREARSLRRDMEKAGHLASGEIPVDDIDAIMARFPPEDAEMETRQRTVESVYGNPYFTDDVEETQRKSQAVLEQEKHLMKKSFTESEMETEENKQQ